METKNRTDEEKTATIRAERERIEAEMLYDMQGSPIGRMLTAVKIKCGTVVLTFGAAPAQFEVQIDEDGITYNTSGCRGRVEVGDGDNDTAETVRLFEAQFEGLKWVHTYSERVATFYRRAQELDRFAAHTWSVCD